MKNNKGTKVQKIGDWSWLSYRIHDSVAGTNAPQKTLTGVMPIQNAVRKDTAQFITQSAAVREHQDKSPTL